MKRMTCKRRFSLLLALMLMLTAFPVTALSVNAVEEPAAAAKIVPDTNWRTDDDGNILIEDVADLMGMLDVFDTLADVDAFEGKNFLLTADIDLNPGWKAGSGTKPTNLWGGIGAFPANFNGQGHTIRGLYITTEASTYTVSTARVGFINNYRNKDNTGSNLNLFMKNTAFDNVYLNGWMHGNADVRAAVIAGRVNRVDLTLENISITNVVLGFEKYKEADTANGKSGKMSLVLGCSETVGSKISATDITVSNITCQSLPSGYTRTYFPFLDPTTNDQVTMKNFTYIIENADQLLGFSKLGTDLRKGWTFRLMADVDLNPGWEPSSGQAPVNVWTVNNFFDGVFDGNGHTIRGLYSNVAGENATAVKGYNGFVGYCQNSVVKDLVLKDCYFRSSGSIQTGGIAGVGNASTVSNVAILNTTITSDGGSVWYNTVGGVFGNARNNVTNGTALIENAVFQGVIDVAGTAAAGCVSGNLQANENTKVTDVAVFAVDKNGKAFTRNPSSITCTQTRVAVNSPATVPEACDGYWMVRDELGAVPVKTADLMSCNLWAQEDTKPGAATFNIRLISSVDRSEKLSSVGFVILLVKENGETVEIKDESLSGITTVYQSVFAAEETVTPDDVNAFDWFYGVVLTGIPATGTYTFRIKTVLTLTDTDPDTGANVTIESNEAVLAYVNGAIAE